MNAASASSEASVPRHVAIIMDGNGRWARKRGLSHLAGHRAGAETVRRVVEECSAQGVEYLTLYAFSTENWSRPKTEISGLMELLNQFLKERRGDLHKQGLRLNVIGNVAGLPASVRNVLQSVAEETREYRRGVLTLALNYGGRDEIVRAVRRIARDVQDGVLSPEDVREETVEQCLDTADLPSPDLLIRTAGEYRLSNFLLWQLSYAEIWVSEVLWPDFSKEDFREALQQYSRRDRRFGGRPCSSTA